MRKGKSGIPVGVLTALGAGMFILCLLLPAEAGFEERFPQPEFTSGYSIPETVYPESRTAFLEYADLGLLFVFLSAASFLALKKRSRRGLYLLAAAAVAYFGFYRRGCVCSIGAVQNVALSLSGASYQIPVPVIGFFILPLLFALFYGRVFCGSVCPLGALQELLIFKPVKVPAAVERAGSFLPLIFLSLAAVFAAAGGLFIICRWDPFIGLFRMSGPPVMITLGLLFLLAGLFIARPYCRFICPYGILLGICSYFSRNHLSISPSECVECRLCSGVCPVNAIKKPSPGGTEIPGRYRMKRTALYIILLPLLALLTGWGVSRSSVFFAEYDRNVRLVRLLTLDDPGGETLEVQSFREGDTPLETLYAETAEVKRKYRTGLWFAGIFLGVSIFIKLIYAVVKHRQDGYEPDRFRCVSCGRCMDFCPVKKG